MEKIIKTLRWFAVGIIVITMGWTAIRFDFNIGKIIKWILGKNKSINSFNSVIDQDGNTIGKAINIIKNTDPLRDKNVLNLSNGAEVILPKGVKDSKIDRVLLSNTGVYNVTPKHKKLTGIFDD